MSDLHKIPQQSLEALEDLRVWRAKQSMDVTALRAALAQQDEPAQEQVIEDAIEAAYWHFDARKKGLNEWASAPQSERDAFKAEARKLVRGYFPTRQAQDTKREMLAVADAFIRGKRAALAQQEEPVATLIAQRDALLEALKEADDLLRIARGALWKLGLNGLGSDTRLSHEVRMFALEFSAESRDGPGVLQVNGTGRALNALKSICAAIKAVEEGK